MSNSSITKPRFRCACDLRRARGRTPLPLAWLERFGPFLLVAPLLLACQKTRAQQARLASTNDDLIALPNAMAVRVRGAQLEAVAPDGALRWKLDLLAGEAVIGEPCAAANSSIFVRTNLALRAASVEGRWLWQADLPLENLRFDGALYEP